MGKTKWRTEPICPETRTDDLWLAEKFQSNSDIAGSPRNRFRPSVEIKPLGGRALNIRWRHLAVLSVIKLRMPKKVVSGVSVWVITSVRKRKRIQIAS